MFRDILALEQIQCRATKFILQDQHSSFVHNYLVRVLVVLLHARFSVVGPILAAIFFRVILYRKYYRRTSRFADTAALVRSSESKGKITL